MFFQYDIHVHAKESSPCAKNSAKEMASAYANAGFAGFVLTDHFARDIILSHGSYEDGVRNQYRTFQIAQEEGNRYGIDVFFGIEFRYHGYDFLTYGIDLPFLLENKDIFDIPFATYAERVHQVGGYICQAHPFRRIGNLPIVIEVSAIDAIEIYNGSHLDDGSTPYPAYYNEMAELFARRTGLPGLAGSDTHDVVRETNTPFRKASLLFDHKITDIRHLIASFRSGRYTICKI